MTPTKTRILGGPWPRTAATIPREDPPGERGKNEISGVSEKRKHKISGPHLFWVRPPPLRPPPPPLRPPPLWAPTPLGPHPFGPPPLRTPHPFEHPTTNTPQRTPHTTKKIGQMRSGQIGSTKIGQIRPNKDGQIRFGHIRSRPPRQPTPVWPVHAVQSAQTIVHSFLRLAAIRATPPCEQHDVSQSRRCAMWTPHA